MEIKTTDQNFTIEDNSIKDDDKNVQKVTVNDDDSSVSSELKIDSYIKDGQKAYEILKYDESCEDHNQISYILPLVRTTPKLILFIILNIFTVGIINLFVAWFPKLILYIYYSVTDLKTATNFGIFSKHDKDFEVVDKEIIDLPPIDYNNEDNIVKRFNLNIEHGATQIIIFEYKLFKYIYSSYRDNFEAINYYIRTRQNIIVQDYSTGLVPNEILFMKKIFGICDIDIKINSCGKILFDELTDPFYLFQLYSIILWYCTQYYYYATVIVVLAVISLVLSVVGTYKNLKKIQEISRYSCPVKVYRKNEANNLMQAVEMDSTELVPGDVFEVPEDGLALPCDAILIGGSVIVNESMLTGESTPVIKVRMPETEDIYDTNKPEYEKYILFAGTKIVQKRKLGKSDPIGIVFNTGFNTFKGNLISGILYPKKDKDTFTRDSVKYIIIMCIMVLVGFFISLKFLIVEGDNSAKEIVERFLDLFTTAVPPSLPACLSIGITYSLSRLSDKGIFCIQRDRINKAGSVNILVFDKTGTLTEDHLDIKGFVTTRLNDNNKFAFNNFTDSCIKDSDIIVDHFKQQRNNNYKNRSKDLLQLYVECLACCHCLTYVKEKLIGDPIDVKMFESTGWIMKENIDTGNETNVNPLVLDYIRPNCEPDLVVPFQDNYVVEENLKSRYEIAIVKRFDFSSKLQRMTVIGKNLNENFFKVFCKGSPEKIRDLCDQSTIPEDFDDILNSYTTKGYRVLGMAGKSILLNFSQSQTINQLEVEKNMIFLGLLIVQNKLKERTKESLAIYDKADLRMMMATGDNILTAICVSKECNLIPQNKEMVSCEIENEKGVDRLKWIKLEEDKADNINQSEANLTSHIMSESDINLTSENNINTLNQDTHLLNNTLNSLFDLYPPLSIDAVDNTIKEPPKIKPTATQRHHFNDPKLKYSKTQTMKSMRTKVLPPLIINEAEDPTNLCKDDTFGIATTGAVLERIYMLNEKYMKKKDQSLRSAHEVFRLILKNGRVFARMAPEHKALLVDGLKAEGFTTLMCGDGANDCSALRTAHVSVSLSAEEASIAANFTSKKPDVYCIYELLREGKCSLTTSIQTFKYMMLYSMIQFICVTLCMIFITYLSDFQYLVSDLFIIFPLEWFLAMTKPYHELTHHYPIAGLLSFPVMTSILTHSAIVFVFQFVGYKILKNHYDWENICDFDDNDSPLPCHENTIFFLISLFQYLGLAIAFFVSKPFRQRLFTNWLLMIYLAGAYFYAIWITINCDNWSKKLFKLYDLEKRGDVEDGEDEILPGGKNMKYYVLIIAGVNTVVNIIFEWFVMKLINYCYENREIKRYKEQIEEERLRKINKEFNPEIKDVPIYKYQRVYYHDRRHRNAVNNQISNLK